MATIVQFYDPQDIGTFDIATTQVNKAITFTLSEAACETPKMTLLNGETIVKEYTVGSGLTMNIERTEIVVSLNGADFIDYVDKTLKFNISFIIYGDIEMVMGLKIVRAVL